MFIKLGKWKQDDSISTVIKLLQMNMLRFTKALYISVLPLTSESRTNTINCSKRQSNKYTM
jgi:hypothetical protein